MKILQVGLSYNPGGVESFVMNYYRTLSKRGVIFDFICMYEELAYAQDIKKLGGTIFYIANVKKNPYLFKKQLFEIIKNGQYQAVHVNMLSAANIVPLAVAKKAGAKKIIAHSHNSASPGLLRCVLHRINKRKIDKYATDFFACSKIAAGWLFTEKLIKEDRYKIIPNAVNTEKFLFSAEESKQVKCELGLEEKFVIGHIGRFEEQKNHLFLIEIFAKISEKCKDAVLVLVGEGELKDNIIERAQELGMSEKVRFLGIRKDVQHIWKGFDVFLLPSLFEGLPLVLVEAQAAGVPCIISDTVSKESVITDDVTFLSLEDGPEKWSDKVIKSKNRIRDGKRNAKIMQKFRETGFDIETAADDLFRKYCD